MAAREMRTGIGQSSAIELSAAAKVEAAAEPITHKALPSKTSVPAPSRTAEWGVFFLLLLGVLYFGRDFLLPVVLALLFAMTGRPVVYALERRGVPTVIAAVLTMLIAVVGFGIVLYTVSGPISNLLANLGSYQTLIEEKIAFLRVPLSHALDISRDIENMTSLGANSSVQPVAIERPGVLFQAVSNFGSFATSIAIAMVITLFFLASGDLFTAKLIYVLPTFSDKKLALTIVHKTASEISHYLLAITLINSAFGIAVGLVLWLIGIPNPLLWAILAAIFNYLPYIGVSVLTVAVLIVGILNFDTPTMWLAGPLLIIAMSTIEGQFITPTILGRHLSLNTVSVLLAVVFWGWLWGIPGALIAVPLLVVMKVICERVDGLSAIAEFLAADDPREREPEGGAVKGTNGKS